MNKIRCVLTVLCMLFLVQGLDTQRQYSDVMANIADANYGTFGNNIPDDEVKVLNHVRRERFRFILPRVMREHHTPVQGLVQRTNC